MHGKLWWHLAFLTFLWIHKLQNHHIIFKLETSEQTEDSELLQLNAKEIFIDVKLLEIMVFSLLKYFTAIKFTTEGNPRAFIMLLLLLVEF